MYKVMYINGQWKLIQGERVMTTQGIVIFYKTKHSQHYADSYHVDLDTKSWYQTPQEALLEPVDEENRRHEAAMKAIYELSVQM